MQIFDTLRETLVVTLVGGAGQRLYPLTKDRAKPAVPFGGIYRIIDFTLSNSLNSGLRRICLLTQYKSISLQRHLHVAWNIFHEELGECLISVPPQQRLGERWYLGTADAIFQNIYTLQQERPRRVLVLGGDHVYRMNYAQMLAFHAEAGAHATIACVAVPLAEGMRFGVMEVDRDWRVVGFEEKPPNPCPLPDAPGMCLASMGIYAFDTGPLVQAVSADAKKDSEHDFGKNIIPSMIGRKPVYAFPLRDPLGGEGYWRDIGTLDAYWEANMDLVGGAPPLALDGPDWPVRSFHGHRPPACLTGGARVEDSLLSSGSRVDGARVARSILGPGVRVAPGAEVEECVLFDDVTVGAGAKLRRAVIEKRNCVPPGIKIGYDRGLDARRFSVTERGITVAPKDLPGCKEFWEGWRGGTVGD